MNNRFARIDRAGAGPGPTIAIPPSQPKAGRFPLLTARADGLCCIETWAFAGPYPEPGAVFATALHWYVNAAVERYMPTTAAVQLKPAVMTSWSEDEARRTHAYVVDCFDRALLEVFALQAAGVPREIVGAIRFPLSPRPHARGPVHCPECGGRWIIGRGARYCPHCGAACITLDAGL